MSHKDLAHNIAYLCGAESLVQEYNHLDYLIRSGYLDVYIEEGVGGGVVISAIN